MASWCSGKLVAPENYSHTQQYGLGLRLRIGLNLELGLGVGLRLGLELGLGLRLGLGLGLALVTLWQYGGGKNFPGVTNFPRHRRTCLATRHVPPTQLTWWICWRAASCLHSSFRRPPDSEWPGTPAADCARPACHKSTNIATKLRKIFQLIWDKLTLLIPRLHDEANVKQKHKAHTKRSSSRPGGTKHGANLEHTCVFWRLRHFCFTHASSCKRGITLNSFLFGCWDRHALWLTVNLCHLSYQVLT